MCCTCNIRKKIGNDITYNLKHSCAAEEQDIKFLCAFKQNFRDKSETQVS